MVIHPERDCNRKRGRQGTPSVMGLTIAAVLLGALVVFTGSVAMAQDTDYRAASGSRFHGPCTQD